MSRRLTKEEMLLRTPPGLTEVLSEFTTAVLRSRPDNVIKFAKKYFDDKYTEIYRDSDDDIEPEQAPALSAYRGSVRRKSVAAEKYDPSQDEGESTPVYPKDGAQTRKLSTSVHSIFMFQALEQEQVLQVVNAMKKRQVKAGEVIIKEGDEEADFFYVIDSGTYEISKGGKTVHTYTDSGNFGELALLYNTPRAATITASTDGELWALDRITFRRIVLKTTFQKRQKYENFIDNVPILSTLEPYERMKVCDALRTVTFEDGDVIVKTGDSANTMYFVEEGEVKVLRTNDSGQTKEVSRISVGGYFGELGLISKQPRAADVVSVGQSKCAELDVYAFERLLGSCVELMKRNVANYEQDMHRAFNENKA